MVERTCQMISLFDKTACIVDGLGAESVNLLVFLRFYYILNIFMNIHEYVSEILCIYGHVMKGP